MGNGHDWLRALVAMVASCGPGLSAGADSPPTAAQVRVVVRYDAARAPSRASYEVTVDHTAPLPIASLRIDCGQGPAAVRAVKPVETSDRQSTYLVRDACTRMSSGTEIERVSLLDSSEAVIGSSGPMSVRFPAPRVAFLGATGFGATARVGGAVGGGTVCLVTNTRDSGAGSFRDCVSRSKRIVVLATGGTVELASPLVVSADHLLIAGTKAPGGGFALSRKANASWQNTVEAAGDDQVYRNFRVRHREGPDPLEGDAIHVAKESNRWIGDHLSLTWGDDETWSTHGRDGTLQYSIVAETTNDPGGANKLMLDAGHNVTWQRNVGAVATHRLPTVGGSEVHDYVNNVFYSVAQDRQPIAQFVDCDSDGWGHGQPTHVNLIGNVWRARFGGSDRVIYLYKQRNCRRIPGSAGWGCDGLGVYAGWNQGWDARRRPVDPRASQGPLFRCYHSGRAPDDIGCDGDDNWAYYDDCDSPDQYRSFAEYPVARATSARLATEALEAEVLADAGAFPRDPIDQCVINKVATRTGSEVVNRAAGCNGGSAALAAGAWCSGQGGDADADGMCDAFEEKYLGGPSAVSTMDPDGDAFTNIEEFLQDSDPTDFDPSPQAFGPRAQAP